MSGPRSPTLFIVSDGRGETCTQVVKAAAVQFEDQTYDLVLEAGVRTPRDVREIVERAAEAHGVVFYTLVGPETRQAMREASSTLTLPTVDVLGPALSALHDLFHSAPGATPNLLYATDHERIDRMEAIDYTLKHDDGQRPRDLDQADVVLVGVSRASKSTTCFYLAYHGIRAANVPLVPGVPPPAELLALDPQRVIGLRINVMRLQTVRAARAASMGLGATDPYTDRRELAHEVLAANRTMDERGWRSFDASYMAVEEIAREILRLRGLRRASS